MPVGRARQAASTQWCTPLHSTLAAAPTFDPASLTKAVLKVSPLLTSHDVSAIISKACLWQNHGRPVFPLMLRLTDNFKIWIVAKSYSFTSFSFFSKILIVSFFSSFWEPYALHWLTSSKFFSNLLQYRTVVIQPKRNAGRPEGPALALADVFFYANGRFTETKSRRIDPKVRN